MKTVWGSVRTTPQEGKVEVAYLSYLFALGFVLLNPGNFEYHLANISIKKHCPQELTAIYQINCSDFTETISSTHVYIYANSAWGTKGGKRFLKWTFSTPQKFSSSYSH